MRAVAEVEVVDLEEHADGGRIDRQSTQPAHQLEEGAVAADLLDAHARHVGRRPQRRPPLALEVEAGRDSGARSHRCREPGPGRRRPRPCGRSRSPARTRGACRCRPRAPAPVRSARSPPRRRGGRRRRRSPRGARAARSGPSRRRRRARRPAPPRAGWSRAAAAPAPPSRAGAAPRRRPAASADRRPPRYRRGRGSGPSRALKPRSNVSVVAKRPPQMWAQATPSDRPRSG